MKAFPRWHRWQLKLYRTGTNRWHLKDKNFLQEKFQLPSVSSKIFSPSSEAENSPKSSSKSFFFGLKYVKTSIGIFQNCWAKIDFDTIVRRHMEPAFLGSTESFILEKMRQMYLLTCTEWTSGCSVVTEWLMCSRPVSCPSRPTH